MALPPGTSGWVGSGFDCGCECSFVAGFTYNGAEPDGWFALPPPICQLIFAVSNLRNGCTPIDVDTADITVELFLNGTPISEPVTIVSDIIFWERWKPEAGDIYTATVTLDCGSTIAIREFEYTIPDPANIACDCCDEKTPDYVVVSGLSGACCDFANGTFSLSDISTCIRDNTVNYSAPATGDRCSDSVACEVRTLTTSGYLGGPLDIAYLHKASVRVIVGVGRDPLTGGMFADPNEIRVVVDLSYFAYRKRVEPTLEVTCTNPGGSFSFRSRWTYSAICSNYLTLIATEGDVCSTPPTVGLFFE